MTTPPPALLTPAQLSDLAGVPAGTVRAWAARYGFPAGRRPPGARRHLYTDEDVEAIKGVQRLRDEGLSMPAAIARVRASSVTPAPSIYAALRRHRPDQRPFVLAKADLLQLSRAIEDEHCARAGSGLLLASFQRVRHYRASQRRWRELARTVSCAVALADFDSLRTPRGGPIEVPLPRDHQLGREWTLIADSPQAKACLSAWELAEPRATADGARRFEVIWSFDPATVSDATAVARALIADLAPAVARKIPESPMPAGADRGLRFGVDLATRAYRYLADPDPSPPAVRIDRR